MVDYVENSSADTGLFTKIVPEKLKRTVTATVGRTGENKFSAPKTDAVYSAVQAKETLTAAAEDTDEGIAKRL